MKILVTGSRGQLGSDILKVLDKHQVVGVDKDNLNLFEYQKVKNFINEFHPDVIIHCAAYTAVDLAESDIDLCNKLNIDVTRNLVNIAKTIKAKFIHISTEYVFDGTKDSPYEISDQTNPLSVYGRSKEYAEKIVRAYENHFIIRISWLYGINGKNFIKTMLKLSSSKDTIAVVHDQIGSPTYTVDVATFLLQLLDSAKYGTYHVTNEDFYSWAEFAELVFKLANKSTLIKRITTLEYPTPAKRPYNSRLSKSSLDKAGFKRLPSVENALKRFINELKEQNNE